MTKISQSSTFLPAFFARLDHPLLLDRVVRGVLALFFALSAGVYTNNALGKMRAINADGFTLATLSAGVAILAVGLYSLTLACLYIVRLRPGNKFMGWWPCLSALLGGFLGMGLILFRPRLDLPVAWQILSSLLIFIGMGATAYTLTRLGRSFSILPESRRLVVTGPYKFIRHPLYVMEAIATIGALISFWSWGAAILVLAQFAFQFVRMHYEERVLLENFPEYETYAQTTARLIPGFY